MVSGKSLKNDWVARILSSEDIPYEDEIKTSVDGTRSFQTLQDPAASPSTNNTLITDSVESESSDNDSQFDDFFAENDEDAPITLTADELDNIVSDVEDQDSEMHIDDSFLEDSSFETVEQPTDSLSGDEEPYELNSNIDLDNILDEAEHLTEEAQHIMDEFEDFFEDNNEGPITLSEDELLRISQDGNLEEPEATVESLDLDSANSTSESSFDIPEDDLEAISDDISFETQESSIENQATPVAISAEPDFIDPGETLEETDEKEDDITLSQDELDNILVDTSEEAYQPPSEDDGEISFSPEEMNSILEDTDTETDSNHDLTDLEDPVSASADPFSVNDDEAASLAMQAVTPDSVEQYEDHAQSDNPNADFYNDTSEAVIISEEELEEPNNAAEDNQGQLLTKLKETHLERKGSEDKYQDSDPIEEPIPLYPDDSKLTLIVEDLQNQTLQLAHTGRDSETLDAASEAEPMADLDMPADDGPAAEPEPMADLDMPADDTPAAEPDPMADLDMPADDAPAAEPDPMADLDMPADDAPAAEPDPMADLDIPAEDAPAAEPVPMADLDIPAEDAPQAEPEPMADLDMPADDAPAAEPDPMADLDMPADDAPQAEPDPMADLDMPADDAPAADPDPMADFDMPADDAPQAEADPMADLDMPADDAPAAEPDPMADFDMPADDAPAAEPDPMADLDMPADDAPAAEPDPLADLDTPADDAPDAEPDPMAEAQPVDDFLDTPTDDHPELDNLDDSSPEVDEASEASINRDLNEPKYDALTERDAEGMPDREELRDMISYLDNLLGELPDEVIEKFAKSDYFDLYQKLMTKLDL